MIRNKIVSVTLLVAVSALMAVQACSEEPVSTPTPVPTQPPRATDTPVPVPTDTPEPAPTDTPVPVPTDTPVPVPTDTPVPAPTSIPVPTDTPVPEPTDTPVPEPTNTPIPDPTSTPVPVAPEAAPTPVETALTIDQYLEFCSTSVAPIASTGLPPDITNGAVSELIGNYHAQFSGLNPPPEIVGWHDLQLDIWMAMVEALDRQPKDELLNPIVLLEPVFANLEALISLQLDQDLMDRLNAAGCTGSFVDLEETSVEEPLMTEPQPSAETPADVLAEVRMYAAGCSGLGQLAAGPPEGATYGETSEGVGLIIGLMSTWSAPEVVQEWHNAQLALFEAVKEIVDAEPASDQLDQSKFFALIPNFQAVEAARAAMATDVAALLVDAACIVE
ncbi:MAG: hypothetical protein OXC83_02895 [Chloroflexi bacterium]|nr:hypothetical protein [Chloroflexota bacterium]